jgi:ribosomal protein S4
MWHHFSGLYGKQIKHLVFQKTKKKTAFGKSFFSIIAFLELRLDILLIRMRFVSKLLEANVFLTKKLIYVNGFFKQKNYLVRVNDIIKSTPKNLKHTAPRFFIKKWRMFL